MFWQREDTPLDRAEAEQVAQLKWLESEKRGHDIGDYYAHWIWLTRHRKNWLASATGAAYQSSGHQL